MNKASDMTQPIFHKSFDERAGDRRGAHIWTCNLDATDGGWVDRHDVLSAGELSLARRLRSPLARQRFVRSHVIARYLLAGILQTPAGDIVFDRNPQGKPSVRLSDRNGAAGGDAFDFNFSHSENAFLFGVCFGAAVGVDVEIIRDGFDLLSVAGSFFSPAEMRSLQAARGSDRHSLFFRYWTRREAFAKAVGRGLAAPLNCAEAGDGWKHFQTTLQVGHDRTAAAIVWRN